MKIKKISYVTMNPLHTYITTDKSTIYKVSKVYGDKNVTIAKYCLKKNSELSDFVCYYLDSYIKINEVPNPVLSLIDLGSKQYFVNKGDKLVYIDVDKAVEKLNRFIANLL